MGGRSRERGFGLGVTGAVKARMLALGRGHVSAVCVLGRLRLASAGPRWSVKSVVLDGGSGLAELRRLVSVGSLGAIRDLPDRCLTCVCTLYVRGLLMKRESIVGLYTFGCGGPCSYWFLRTQLGWW